MDWYARRRRDLPWRGTRDPYAIWISEVMLQQTTVAAVIPYYQKWFRLFPDIESLAEARQAGVLKAWQGLGYYRRARDLQAAAKVVVDRHGGRLPDDAEALRALPGFGPYTTAAVSSLAFGRPVPLVEANVRRVLMRLYGREGPAAAKNDAAWLAILAPLLPARRPGDFNQAWMELGALVCRPANPACLSCPLRRDCRAYASGRQEVIPAPVKRIYRKITAVVGIIERDGRILIQRRPPDGLLAGLWEFPGGKVRRRESLKAALARELEEEIGVRPEAMQPFMTVDHSYTTFRVTLHAFTCGLRSGPAASPDRKWVRPGSLRRYPFPSGSARIVERILAERHRTR
ncbi:MAG: A/G-specific adenine glycosylase [Acidobacteriota bacterium]|nr:A/G-specific adenine glycosylase [Acidobacteriota bacterium]